MFVALAAQARGLRVALFEPRADLPNNLAISGGLLPVAGSALQRAAGVTDSPEAWLADLRQFAPGMVNEQIAEAVALALPAACDFLQAQCAAPASGQALHQWLRQAVRSAPGISWLEGSAEVERSGGGFELRSPQGLFADLRADQLVLAGGGFGANTAMVAQYIPGMGGALHNGSATNDGSTIALGLRWGAQLWGMDGYQGQGHTNPGGVTRLGMGIPSLGGILVNREGRRFVAEDIGPSALAPQVLAQSGGIALELFDQAIEDQLGNHSAYQQARQAGCVMCAQTLPELAALAGIDAGALQHTLDEVAACAQGQADRLGRRSFARVLGAPWRASWVTGALSHTQGGLLTDAHGAVLHESGQRIPGLFAAGGCAAGLSGRGADGYLPGNGLAQAFGLGWRVAQALG
jgi:fumarate reductase flavoprotein subunit